MIDTRKVTVTHIEYTDREKYLSVCGQGALEQFVNQQLFNCYDAKSAPKEIVVEIKADFDNIDDIFDKAWKKAEEDTGLTIKKCLVMFNE